MNSTMKKQIVDILKEDIGGYEDFVFEGVADRIVEVGNQEYLRGIQAAIETLQERRHEYRELAPHRVSPFTVAICDLNIFLQEQQSTPPAVAEEKGDKND